MLKHSAHHNAVGINELDKSNCSKDNRNYYIVDDFLEICNIIQVFIKEFDDDKIYFQEIYKYIKSSMITYYKREN